MVDKAPRAQELIYATRQELIFLCLSHSGGRNQYIEVVESLSALKMFLDTTHHTLGTAGNRQTDGPPLALQR